MQSGRPKQPFHVLKMGINPQRVIGSCDGRPAEALNKAGIAEQRIDRACRRGVGPTAACGNQDAGD